MDLKSLFQLPANFIENSTLKFNFGMMAYEIKGKDLLKVREESPILISVISTCFINPRIMWEDFSHELRFVPAERRLAVCRESVNNILTGIDECLILISKIRFNAVFFIDLFTAFKNTIIDCKKSFIDKDDYNNFIRNSIYDSEDLWSDDDQLTNLFDVIKNMRVSTYPIILSLIDMLPEGQVKNDACGYLKKGYMSVGLDYLSVAPDWVIENNRA